MSKKILTRSGKICAGKIDKQNPLCYNLIEYAKGETNYVPDVQQQNGLPGHYCFFFVFFHYSRYLMWYSTSQNRAFF